MPICNNRYKWCLKTLFPRLLLTHGPRNVTKVRSCLLPVPESVQMFVLAYLLTTGPRKLANVLAYYWLSEMWQMNAYTYCWSPV